MMDQWIAIIRVAPYSGVEQKDVGKLQQKYLFDADGIDNALRMTKAIEQGIRSNPAVWETWIEGIIKKDNGIDP